MPTRKKATKKKAAKAAVKTKPALRPQPAPEPEPKPWERRRRRLELIAGQLMLERSMVRSLVAQQREVIDKAFEIADAGQLEYCGPIKIEVEDYARGSIRGRRLLVDGRPADEFGPFASEAK